MWRAAPASDGDSPVVENALLLVLAFALLVYLTYALMRPEKF
jgi:K+-transporting ATPase KdpF subunit